MVKHTQNGQTQTLSVFEHFVGLALEGLREFRTLSPSTDYNC